MTTLLVPEVGVVSSTGTLLVPEIGVVALGAAAEPATVEPTVVTFTFTAHAPDVPAEVSIAVGLTQFALSLGIPTIGYSIVPGTPTFFVPGLGIVTTDTTLLAPPLIQIGTGEVDPAVELDIPRTSFTFSLGQPSLPIGVLIAPETVTFTLTIPTPTAEVTSNVTHVPGISFSFTPLVPSLDFTGSYTFYDRSVEDTFALSSLSLSQLLAQMVGSESLDFTPQARNGVGISALDALTVTDTHGATLTANMALSEHLALTDLSGATLVVVGTASTGFVFYLLAESADSYEVWTMNTDTLALSKYSGMAFNSYASLGGKTFGIRADGLYELTGTTDNESEIEAYVRTGLLDFATYAQKNVYRAYLYMKSDAPVYLKTLTDERGERKERWYEVSVQASTGVPHSRMVRLPRGVTAVRWGFEVRTIDGGDLDLLGFEVQPVLLRRIVGR